jgi:hypothetical protein
VAIDLRIPREFLEHLGDYQLFKGHNAPCGDLVSKAGKAVSQ